LANRGTSIPKKKKKLIRGTPAAEFGQELKPLTIKENEMELTNEIFAPP
jgi:hypothetical protein